MPRVLDENTLMRQALLDTSTPEGVALNAQVGARIYMGSFPGRDTWENAAKAIVCFRNGGVSNMDIPLHTPEWRIECYGGSTNPRDAADVERALHARLSTIHMEQHSSGMFMSATEVVHGQDGFDDEREWPLVMTLWQTEMRPA